ncbi:S-adenosyl-L-methionine-dependent methyltransferase [Trema orientale]|uniref:S-adenosyl-L-methionine-dependent methyltransferase n=1 Tax=Trema orientale TaxID=63057 RepID=A0A2P5ECC8_TREOI|nr:S-adenosyl-L-methionine-dependent methyltransferase [Trema orientale]
MDSQNKYSKSLSTNLFFLFLLLSTNLLTLFFSSTFYSSCSFTPSSTTIKPTNTPTPTPTHTTTTPTTATKLSTKGTDNYFEPNKDSIPDLPSEFLAYTSGQLLPFGYSTNFDSDTIFPPVGLSCTRFPGELRRYMSYQVNGSCPDDELLAQKLLLKGCEPLPRRRCRPAASPDNVEPYPLPTSLWSTPNDSSVVWTAYTCKNYDCLINRSRNQKGFDDCKDCFDLQGREKTRWSTSKDSKYGGLDFGIDEVLGTRKPGTVRIGLDIGGGAATFAVRMMERNVTIVTTSMNLNGPFNSFIASRGVVPLYISVSQRLPFFDNTLDIVHSMHVLSNWIPTTLLHFLLFDIYRVLRPGGIFWLDHFFCAGDQLEEVYGPIIESVGFNKLKWVVGRKLDRGPELREMYLSALLEKPLKNSW